MAREPQAGAGIAEFLKARLDEDEAAARAATPGPWLALDGGVQSAGDEWQWPVADTDSARNREDRAHVARHDPARALREVATKRRIVKMASVLARTPPNPAVGAFGTEMLKQLAAVWSDHPAYRPEWRP